MGVTLESASKYLNWCKCGDSNNSEPIDYDALNSFIDHQLEYLQWVCINDQVIVYGCGNSLDSPVSLLGIFYGKDKEFEVIKEKFIKYVLEYKNVIFSFIVDSLQKFQREFDSTCEKISVPYYWKKFFNLNNRKGFNVQLQSDEKNSSKKIIIYSPENMGRYKEIKLPEILNL